MPDKEKVETFRLTPEMKNWAKNYRQIDQVTKMIEQGLRIQFSELENTRRMFEQAQGKKAEMLKLAPKEQTRELPGQEY